MKAVRVYDALKCPNCYQIIDPDEHDSPEPVDTWRCGDCGHVSDDGPYQVARCGHEPSEIVQERCAECYEWQNPQALSPRKACPLCDGWIDPEDVDFDDEVEVYRCGECDTINEDRDEAMECCR